MVVGFNDFENRRAVFIKLEMVIKYFYKNKRHRNILLHRMFL